MDDLKRMGIFYHVVEAGGFTAASKRLGIAKSAVSRHVSVLEQDMGVRLLNRTTRQMSLTEAGETYFHACEKIIHDAEEVTRNVSGVSGKLTGTLRISCPIALGSDYVVPIVKAFSDIHSDLKIELIVDDQVVNMVDEGIDISIRVGWLDDSGLIARKLTNSPRLLCASPDYLKQFPELVSPEQLSFHQWVIFTLLPTPYRQIVSRQGSQQTLRVNGRFKTNNILTLRSMLLEGAGVGVLAKFLVEEDIRKGRLVNLLQNYDFGEAGVYAVYADRRLIPSKVRQFIDYLIETLKL